MTGNCHVRCGAGEKAAIVSKPYLSLFSLPDDFEKILSVMRSRGVSVSIILQNLAQLKALFEKQWESICGNCDSFLYCSWYGFAERVEWCACFVSWCANELGYIDAGIMPKFSGCQSQWIPWFQARGQWQDSLSSGGGYTAKPGDIIFFDWDGDGISDHVGIVECVEGEFIHTIEGNTSDSVARRSYRLDSGRIMGFGVPVYP